MKNKLSLSILLFFIISISEIYAQIENEIKSFVDSTEMLVANGRKMLMVKISDEEYNKVLDIYEYLNYITEGENYAAFSFTEQLYINILIENWFQVSNLMIDWQKYMKRYAYPDIHEIYSVLYNKILENSERLMNSCKNSSLGEEDKDIIALYLLYLNKGYPNAEYDNKYQELHEKYKYTQYASFSRGY